MCYSPDDVLSLPKRLRETARLHNAFGGSEDLENVLVEAALVIEAFLKVTAGIQAEPTK